MFVYRWISKLLIELRFFKCTYVWFFHTMTQTGFVFVLHCLLTHDSLPAFFVCVWLKYWFGEFIIFSGQKVENYKPINPCVWSSSHFPPVCVLPSLLYVHLISFTCYSTDLSCLGSWEVICLYDRAVLSSSLSKMERPNPLGSSSLSSRYVVVSLAVLCTYVM